MLYLPFKKDVIIVTKLYFKSHFLRIINDFAIIEKPEKKKKNSYKIIKMNSKKEPEFKLEWELKTITKYL